jgi:hypothetical protein
MKTILFLILALLNPVNGLMAQSNAANANVSVAVNKKKTEVFTGDKGELRINVSNEDAAKMLKNGYVDYETFGARGDGVSDDLDVIAAAHSYANQLNLPVRTKANAVYYIGGKNRRVVILTNTDFGSSKFIIDDRNVEKVGDHVFFVNSLQESVKLRGIKTLKRNQAKIDATFSAGQVISVTNNKVMRYIRFGGNQNSGAAQTDVFIVDKDGNVDKNTPIIWDFDDISTITALPVDADVLTIKGGHFQTIANAEGIKTNYYSRGIAIRRSNVVVDGLLHTITDEGEFGAPYTGFISISQCAFVTIQNTTLTGRKVYRKKGNAGWTVPMGTYGLSANRALNVSVINCKQTNDINDNRYWGIFASNYCKNILFDNCVFSRFDAHMGVANATIRNCTFGHQGINAIGEGLLLIENTTVHSNRFISLRSDYGSTWNGEIIIRNSVLEPVAGNLSALTIITGENSGQHDFGYTCYMPERLSIENFQIKDAQLGGAYKGTTIFSNFNSKRTDETYVEKFPYVLIKEIILRNISIESGKALRVSDNQFMFKDVKMTEL